MKFPSVVILLFCVSLTYGQKVIPLYSGQAPGSESWSWDEQEMFSDVWQTRVVYNVSRPTLTAYLPSPHKSVGTAVIICPGGAFHALSIDSEGNDVARWLAARGVAAFVLKYRLVKSETSDPVTELSRKMAAGSRFDEDNARLIPLAIADGLEAVRHVRKNAREYNINPERVGIMGFSAGGTVASGVLFEGKDESRPDFGAPVYAYIPPSMRDSAVPDDAAPLFVVAASDDQLGLAPHSVSLYSKWLAARKPAEIHIYQNGGHGFGMRTQDMPSDTWIDRFGEWMETQHLLMSPNAATTPQQVWQRRKEGEARFNSDWPNLQRYREENRKLAPPEPGENRVVFMGNSITARWSEVHPEFFDGRPYINRGIGSQTTPQMLLRFHQDVISLRPAVVVILAGINDIAHVTGPASSEEIMANISGMALLAKSHGIKVVLSSLLPAYDFPSKPGMEPAGKVIALNKMIREFAAGNGFHYLDYFSALVDSRNGMKKEFSNDEVHPTLEGYKVMEALVEKAIETVLKEQ